VTHDSTLYVFVAVAAWSLAVGGKAVRTLRSQQPYVFDFWDGGLLRQGKALTNAGARAKVGVNSAVVLLSALVVLGVLGLRTAALSIIPCLVVGLVCDFIFEQK
jgi:hypothetical protein